MLCIGHWVTRQLLDKLIVQLLNAARVCSILGHQISDQLRRVIEGVAGLLLSPFNYFSSLKRVAFVTVPPRHQC
jgi:hypothetical protein